MTIIDVIYLIVILFFAIIGIKNGFIKEVFGKLAVILGIIAGISFTSSLQPAMSKFISNTAVSTVVSFFILFVAVFLLVHIVQVIVAKIFEGDILQGLDRVLGFIIGAAEGAVVVCLLLILMISQPWSEDIQRFAQNGMFYTILNPFIASPIEYMQGVFVNV